MESNVMLHRVAQICRFQRDLIGEHLKVQVKVYINSPDILEGSADVE